MTRREEEVLLLKMDQFLSHASSSYLMQFLPSFFSFLLNVLKIVGIFGSYPNCYYHMKIQLDYNKYFASVCRLVWNISLSKAKAQAS